MPKNFIQNTALNLIFSLALGRMVPDSAPIVFIVLLLISLFPNRKILIISFASVLFQFFPGKLSFFYLSKETSKLMHPELPDWMTQLGWFSGALGIFTLFLLIALRTILLSKIKWKWSYSGGITLVLGIFFLLSGLITSRILNPVLDVILIWMTVGLAKYIWFFAYDLQNTKPETLAWSNILQRPAFYSPFWTFRLIAPTIPKGESFWTKFDVPEDKIIETRVRAIGLIAWAVVLNFVTDKFETFLRTTQLDDFRLFSIDGMLLMLQKGQTLSPPQVIISGLSDNLLNFLNIVIWGHVAVSTVWFCGYKIPKNTNMPFLSSDPLEFFSRYNFYLKEIVFQLFYFPCFLRLKKWRLSLRVFVAILFAVCIGKFLVNYTKMVTLILKMGVFNSLKQHLPYFIYCFLLSLCLYPFLLQSIRGAPKKPLMLYQKIFYSLIIFWGYTALRMFDTLRVADASINLRLFLLFLGINL